MPGHDLQWTAENLHTSLPSARIYKRQDHTAPASGKQTDLHSPQAPRNLLFVPAHGIRLGSFKSLCKAALKQWDCDIPTAVRPCDRCQTCSKQSVRLLCASCDAYICFTSALSTGGQQQHFVESAPSGLTMCGSLHRIMSSINCTSSFSSSSVNEYRNSRSAIGCTPSRRALHTYTAYCRHISAVVTRFSTWWLYAAFTSRVPYLASTATAKHPPAACCAHTGTTSTSSHSATHCWIHELLTDANVALLRMQ